MTDDRDRAAGFEKGRRRVDRTVGLRAPAKVNLHLEVLRRRHDGYHEIETVLQALDIYDQVGVTLGEERLSGEPDIAMTVTGDADGIPADETNLCWRAAALFCRKRRVSGQLTIRLDKAIPAAAGLGGGSSDAAAVLVACDRLFGAGLEPAELEAMGAELGADVPFFVRGGTALGRGIGATLTALPRLADCRFVIVKPPMELKTPDVYGRLKMGLTVHSPKANIGVIRPMLARFPQRTWPGFNRLEDVVLPSHPALQRLVLRMRELAPVAMLSGSGSAVYAAVGRDADPTRIGGEFEAAGWFVRVSKPCAAGVEITEDRRAAGEPEDR
jgi:4-diphosphocytidyl-2-C-methyl-D-erythritol kinase